MKISVIIVNYNVKYYLEQCLLSLRKALEGIDSEVLVVDNHSKDGSVEYLRKRFREVHFVASNHNLGFARGNNLAIRRAKGEYVLLLNPDTIVGEDAIRESIAFMDSHPEAGGLGVKMLKCDGGKAMESRRGLPTPLTSLYKMCGLCTHYPQSRRFGKYYMSYLPWDKPQRIEVISGAYCLLRHSALDKIGLLDEDFFMYGEDIDLSYRLIKGGFENWYLPVSILHYKGESTHKSSYRYVHVFYEAMLIFFKKHYRHYGMLLSFPIMLAIVLRAALALVVQQGQALRKFLFPHPDTKPRRMLYIGRSADMVKQIAEEYGLDMDFYNADEQRLPEGHLSSCLKSTDYEHIIYDTDDFSRAFILERFRENPLPRVFMGTFNPQRGVIVTVSHVYNS